jgi:hypothetical protein
VTMPGATRPLLSMPLAGPQSFPQRAFGRNQEDGLISGISVLLPNALGQPLRCFRAHQP